MFRLEELARQVVQSWETSDLQVRVRDLACHLREIDADRKQCAAHIKRARALHASDGIEFDDQPIVSPAWQPGGAFVNAWVWVDQPGDDV